MKDIKQELLKIAEENVNKKLEKEMEKNKKRTEKEIEDVNFILELIEKRMLFKITGSWSEPKRFVLITKEIFLEDYSKERKYDWQEKLQVKKYDNWRDNYKLDIVVNGIRYEHIGCLMQDYRNELKKEQERVKEISIELRESAKRYEKLQEQEATIKTFIEDYNSTERYLNQKE